MKIINFAARNQPKNHLKAASAAFRTVSYTHLTQKNTKTIIVGEGRGFDRIRRITGYLVGTTDRWNDAKRAEEHDRVKHSL